MESDSDPPYVHSAELQRWSDTYTPGYAQMTEDALSATRKSPFTYSPQINAKIAYWLVVILVYMQFRLINSQPYLTVGLVGLGLPLTLTIRVSRVSAMVSARFNIH